MHKLPLRVDCTISLAQLQTSMPEAVISDDVGEISGVCLDSRAIMPGDLFFAIRAARDGHAFVERALAQGAAAVVIDHDMQVDRQVKVENTLDSLHQLAKYYRRSWGGTVVGVSGSNGKTTTKEIVQALLGEEAFSTPGTWNNHLGIPLALLMLRPEHKIAVMEMGINQYGDLQGYCQYAMPDIGVLTVIGDSHLMNLTNKQGVQKAKAELFHALPATGKAIINIDDPYLRPFQELLDVDLYTVSTQGQADVFAKFLGESVIEVTFGEEKFESPFHLVGQHNLSNLVCALGVAMACGKTAASLRDKIQTIKSLDMRMQQYTTKGNIRVIIDCYNANPTSTLAGLEMLSSMDGRKIAFLGDMLELGVESSKMHMDLARKLKNLSIDMVFLIGQFAKDYYQGALLGGLVESQVHLLRDREVACEKIRAQLQSGDILYVKGSRGMRLEEIIQPLL